MTFNKKYIKFTLISVLTLFIVSGWGNKEQTAEAQAKKKMVLRMGGAHPVDSFATKASESFCKKIKERTNGRIEIQFYPAQQLGDYTQMYEELIRGSIDIGHIYVPDQYDTRLSVNYLPYLGSTYTEVKKVFSSGSYLSNKIAEIHETKRVKFLGFYGEGFTGVATSKEITEPTNYSVDKGLLVRVPPLAGFKFAAEDMGFRTTTIPFAETYTALQTGVADGWVGGSPMLQYLWFRDVIKYFYLYNDHFDTSSMLISSKCWKSLSPEDQIIIKQAAEEECAESFDLAKANNEKYIKLLKEMGIKIIDFNPNEKNSILQHCREVTWDRLKEKYTEEIIEALRKNI